MAKRKALSPEEKRCKLLELFHETADVYQLKDLERIAPKEKGIVQQSIKTVLQELVDNGEVHCEKIAGSLYYWSFPSEALNQIKIQLDSTETEALKLEERIQKANENLQVAEKNVTEDTDAEFLTKEIEVLKKEKQELQQKLAALSNEIDYEKVMAKQKDCKGLLNAANRWTDNIFLIKSWCKTKFDKQDKELDKAFGIPEDLDYVE